YHDHRDLHSFPTRRSSDLTILFSCALKSDVDHFTGNARDTFHTERGLCSSFSNEMVTSTGVKMKLSMASKHHLINSDRVSMPLRSEEHTSELQSREKLVCR